MVRKSGVVVRQMEGKREVGGSSLTPDVFMSTPRGRLSPCSRQRQRQGRGETRQARDKAGERQGRRETRQARDKTGGRQGTEGRASVGRRQSIETEEEAEYRGKKEEGENGEEC